MVKYGEPCVIGGDEGREIQPVVFDPPLTQAEADAYWEALDDTDDGDKHNGRQV